MENIKQQIRNAGTLIHLERLADIVFKFHTERGVPWKTSVRIIEESGVLDLEMSDEQVEEALNHYYKLMENVL